VCYETIELFLVPSMKQAKIGGALFVIRFGDVSLLISEVLNVSFILLFFSVVYMDFCVQGRTLFHRRFSHTFPTIGVFLSLFTVFSIISVIIGIHRNNPLLFKELRIFVPILIAYIVYVILSDVPDVFAWVKKRFEAVYFMLVIFAVFHLAVYISPNWSYEFGRGSWEMLAIYICMFCIALAKWIYFGNPVDYLIALLLMVSINITLSKPVTFAFLISVITLPVIQKSSRKIGIRIARFGAFVVPIVILVLLLLSSKVPILNSESFEDYESYVRRRYLKIHPQTYERLDISSGRFSIWSEAVRQWRKNPVFGVGFGKDIDAYPLFHKRKLFDRGKQLHNIVLYFLYQGGLIHGLSVLILLLLYLHLGLTRIAQLCSSRHNFLLAALYAFTVGILGFNLVGLPFKQPRLAMLWGISVGISLRHLVTRSHTASLDGPCPIKLPRSNTS